MKRGSISLFTRKCRLSGAILLMIGMIMSPLSGCKGKGGDGTDSLVTPEAVQEGFAAANETLVKQREKELKEIVAVKVGDADVSMQTAMFLIYSMEVQGNSYAAYYESQFGVDYWGMEYDELGRTTREVFKEETIDALIQYAVLYDCAVKDGMFLTEEEVAENNAFVANLTGLLSAEETERAGFTEENLRETCGWMMLGEKYYKKMTENLGITKEDIEKSIKIKDYKEYETEYVYLPTTYYDEEYNICDESEAVVKERKERIQKYYEQVVAGATFEDLAFGDEELVHKTRTFLEKGDEAEALYKSVAMNLEVGEVSAPVQTEYGVYLIRMVDDACTKTYDATVAAEYEVRKNEAFQIAYEVLLDTYDVSVNEAAWKEIILGATVSFPE